ncbi:hypothetical protein EYC80_006444 [Monilinia laxa]|uniref:Uncharacterized protein n=1 Tax=Monilinia laxa TaxID=61186 RepID=A0A5N6JUU0_MONLA|nr:hypothetical protein EYC80_006444 [Monilinia laxa]
MAILRFFKSLRLPRPVQQNRSIQLATIAPLEVPHKPNLIHFSGSSTPMISIPATKTAQTTHATQVTPSYIYTEVTVGKLCDTLWMEKNVIGYKGAKRVDILKAVLKRNEKKCEESHGRGCEEKEEKIQDVMKDVLKEMEKNISEREGAERQIWERMGSGGQGNRERSESVKFQMSGDDDNDQMSFHLLNQGVSTGR